jgi:putative FmdB family regulatory protein
MPLYDFACRSCGETFEGLVRPERPAVTCPKCGGTELERMPSGFAVSSAESRAASAKQSREHQVRAHKDKAIADIEYRKEHEGH